MALGTGPAASGVGPQRHQRVVQRAGVCGTGRNTDAVPGVEKSEYCSVVQCIVELYSIVQCSLV